VTSREPDLKSLVVVVLELAVSSVSLFVMVWCCIFPEIFPLDGECERRRCAILTSWGHFTFANWR
jgi:hypothetical protein